MRTEAIWAPFTRAAANGLAASHLRWSRCTACVSAPVLNTAGVEEVQAAGNVQRDLLAARLPGVLAIRVLGERMPQVAALSCNPVAYAHSAPPPPNRALTQLCTDGAVYGSLKRQ